MASYYEYFKTKVEGTDESVKSICEAIRNYAPDGEIDCSNNTIVVRNMYKIRDTDDAFDFAQILARASTGANFKCTGDTECSVSGEMMAFVIEIKNGELTFCDSEWYIESTPSMYEEYETFEEYYEDYEDEGDIENEEEFQIIKSQNVYFVDGELHLEIPYLETVKIEY